jgi:succinate dehydrogenase / fumarate reductase cytochrome b subunit
MVRDALDLNYTSRSTDAADALPVMPHAQKQRPVFFNVAKIQLPVGALTSITHRITGVLLALGIPFCIYLLDRSLQGPSGYSQVMGLLEHLPVKGAVIVWTWALAHHVLAGIRHLLSDIDIGSQLPASRRSAWIANIGGLAVALLVASALL